MSGLLLWHEKKGKTERQISSASPNSSTSTVQRKGVQTPFLILTLLRTLVIYTNMLTPLNPYKPIVLWQPDMSLMHSCCEWIPELEKGCFCGEGEAGVGLGGMPSNGRDPATQQPFRQHSSACHKYFHWSEPDIGQTRRCNAFMTWKK